MAEIAEAEGMDLTHVRRVMRLTLLAPKILERLNRLALRRAGEGDAPALAQQLGCTETGTARPYPGLNYRFRPFSDVGQARGLTRFLTVAYATAAASVHA